jgi:hypothetical protein
VKRYSILIAAMLVSSAILSAAQAAAKFEGISLPGTSKSNSGFFQIEVATGKVLTVWGNTNANFTAIQDAAPLPPGDYHLYVQPNPQPDGSSYWMINRMDGNTGRTWSLAGGGDAPYSWTAVAPPK